MRALLFGSEEPVILYHVTSESCIRGIKENGILASSYGDLPVGDNDGYGVYAFCSKDKAKEYAVNCIDDEPQHVVTFLHYGEWYQCIDEMLTEEEIEEGQEKYHIGYVVIPQCIPVSSILSTEPVYM